jgi:hypothetical protein
MTRTVSASVLSSVLALVPATGWCAASLERYALVIGANSGGANRPQLLYAVSDAERFARVMIELGGVAPANEILLKQPKLHDLIVALDTLTRRVADARKRTPPVGRTEVILYYSGHADEQGLLLGDNRYSYRTLRDRLDQIPADVRIAVLDACSSGAFTRVKGGRARPPFMIDEAADMRGHAFLTSSAETEAAQESDRIRASYFTHYLISGFRGAADVSRDGKVTLNEAYQFAFNETLGRTVDTKGGAQHPSYDISLSGSGDIVMTDVRQTTSTLVLGEDLDGRFFVRTASQELVVELYKPCGRVVELAVEPGTYEVRVERQKGSVTARAEVVDGARVAIDPRQFGPVAMEPTRRRGDSTRYAVAGRNRIEMRLGSWRVHGPPVPAVITPAVVPFLGNAVDLDSAASLFGGFAYTRFVRENLAATVAVDGVGVSSEAKASAGKTLRSDTAAALAIPVGIRWNPLRGDHTTQAFKPFVAAAIGPVVQLANRSVVFGRAVSAESTARTRVGAQLGAGVDVFASRSFSLGMSVTYNVTSDFPERVGVWRNFNGVQAAFGVGWVFGKGNSSTLMRLR